MAGMICDTQTNNESPKSPNWMVMPLRLSSGVKFQSLGNYRIIAINCLAIKHSYVFKWNKQQKLH